MEKSSSNGDQQTTKPPPTPSPLRFSKFFQVKFILEKGNEERKWNLFLIFLCAVYILNIEALPVIFFYGLLILPMPS